MLGYLIAVLRATTAGVGTVCNKNFMRNTKDVKSGLDIYMLILYPIATVFYFVMAGCDASLNMPTFIFSVINAVLSILCTVVSMVGYNFATIVYLNVFGIAGPTVIIFLYELLFTDDTFTKWGVVSVIIRLMAVSIPLIFSKKEKGMGKKGFLICIIYFILGGIANIFSRTYVNAPNVLSTASLCFWTNVFMLPLAFANTFRKCGVKTLIKESKQIGAKNYMYVVANAIIGNAGTLLSFEVVKLLGGTISSVISGSLSLLVATFVSAVIYKEKTTLQSWSSIILSIVAVILSVF